MSRLSIRCTPYALFAAVILIVAFGLHQSVIRPAPVIDWTGKTAPAIYLPSLSSDAGLAGAHFKSGAWRGRPYIVHFFASRCATCQVEQEELMTFAAAHIPIVGIVFHDQAARIDAWLRANGNPYALVALDPGQQAARAWGVTAVPATFIVDDEGIVRWQSNGPVSADTAQNIIMPLWEDLRAIPGQL